MKPVPLYGDVAAGRVALVDDDDWDLVSGRRWNLHVTIRSGRPNGPYARAKGRSGSVMMHTLITGWNRVDHVDHDGLNNQRSNLRPATVGQNKANQRKRSDAIHSEFKGVRWKKRNPGRNYDYWVAQICVDGKRRTVGYFRTEIDAARAYDAAARDAWGAYALLNFPLERS